MDDFDEKPHGKMIGLLWLAIAVGGAWFITLGLPIIVAKIPMSWESSMAQGLGNPVGSHAECPPNPLADELLKRVVHRLYPLNENEKQIELRVRVLDATEINAFAYLGGQIWVLKGLMKFAHSPEELAGVLAHEIEHVTHRHILQGAAGSLLLRFAFSWGAGTDAGPMMEKIMNMKFTSRQEEEADAAALDRLAKAHIPLSGLHDFFERLEKKDGDVPSLLSDHPSSQSRAQLIETRSVFKTEPLMTATEWARLQKICGA